MKQKTNLANMLQLEHDEKKVLIEKREEFEKELEEFYSKKQIAFWDKYEIPFTFTVEIKETLSGLSGKSFGDGRKNNSVNHLYLSDKKQYLCDKKYNYGNWSGNLGLGLFYNDLPYVVNCQKCLKLMKKYETLHHRND